MSLCSRHFVYTNSQLEVGQSCGRRSQASSTLIMHPIWQLLREAKEAIVDEDKGLPLITIILIVGVVIVL